MRTRKTWLAILAAFTLPSVAAGVHTPTPAAADPPTTGAITGTVTGPDGLPRAGIPVDAGGSITTTAADGTYELVGLPSGSHVVRFNTLASPYPELLTKYYRNANTYATATPVTVTVTAGATTAGIDQRLPLGRSISGTVTGPDGLPRAGVRVQVDGNTIARTTTAGDGTYTVVGLRNGNYTVSFFPSTADAELLTEWYSNQNDPGGANPVAVALGATTTGIDAQLEVGGTMSGTVTGPDGLPREGIYVSAGVNWGGGSTVTAADGSYTINGLRSADYRVCFRPDPYPELIAEYYDRASRSRCTREPASVASRPPSPSSTERIASTTWHPAPIGSACTTGRATTSPSGGPTNPTLPPPTRSWSPPATRGPLTQPSLRRGRDVLLQRRAQPWHQLRRQDDRSRLHHRVARRLPHLQRVDPAPLHRRPPTHDRSHPRSQPLRGLPAAEKSVQQTSPDVLVDRAVGIAPPTSARTDGDGCQASAMRPSRWP
jgi:hypothetical protein